MGKIVDNCVFCRIVRGEIPATVVLLDELTLAFMDIGSVNPGHMLVAAKPHVENLQGMDAELAGAMFRSAARAARAIEAVFRPGGISVYQANGAAAGQTVFHYHMHLMPRTSGEPLMLHSRSAGDPGRLRVLATALSAAMPPA